MKWDDAKADEALRGRRSVRPVEFPGAPHIKVGVRMLSDSELDLCKQRAQTVCEDSRAMQVLDFYPRVLDREVIAQAFVDMSTVGKGKEPEPFFADQKFVAELDAGVITQLATLYSEHCKDADPLVHLDDDEAIRGVVQTLGKERSSRALLSGFDHETLVSLCASLASLLHETSPTPSSSTGSS